MANRWRPSLEPLLARVFTCVISLALLAILMIIPFSVWWFMSRITSLWVAVAAGAATFIFELAALKRWHGNKDHPKEIKPKEGSAPLENGLVLDLPCDAERERCPVPCRQCPIYFAFMEEERDAGRAPLYEPTNNPDWRDAD